MNQRRALFLLPAIFASAIPVLAYVEERYTLARVINESTNIVVMQVERVNKEKKLIIYAGVVTADFNKDGTLDLVLLGNDPDPCVVLLSKMKGKRTPVTIRCAGPDSAIGAHVQVAALDGKVLGRQILGGGDGRNMQVATEARFALAPGKYRVEVRYSSGQTQTRKVEVGERPVWATVDSKAAVVPAK